MPVVANLVTGPVPGIFRLQKVDAHADLIDAQPFIVTNIELSGLFSIGQYSYQQTFVVGDTATLVGKLFLDRSDTRITLGNVLVNIIQKANVSTQTLDSRTGKMDSLNLGRFLITKEMVGKNLPLTVTANGYMVQGPPVTVLLINNGDRRTDTTLVVDELTAWLPANVSAFQNNGSPLVNNVSVAGDGTIYFDNLNGIFRLAGGQVSLVLAPGNTLTDQAQQTFTVDVIVSSVISLDGNTLFSRITLLPCVPRILQQWTSYRCHFSVYFVI